MFLICPPRRVFALTLSATCLLVAGCSENREYASERPAEDAVEVSDVRPPAGPPDPLELCAITGTRETASACAEMATGLEGLKAGVDAFRPEQPMLRDEPTVVRYSLVVLPEEIQGEDGELAIPVEARPPSPTVMAKHAGSLAGAAAGGGAEGPTEQEIAQEVAKARSEVTENVAREDEAAAVETGQIKVGRRMFACLSGDRIFEVTPAECQSYNMVENPQPVWKWQVTPRAGGRNYKLYLRSGIEIEGPDGTPRRIGRYAKTEEIRVDVSTLGKFQDAMRLAEAWFRTPIGAIAGLTALLLAIGGLIGAARRAREGKGA